MRLTEMSYVLVRDPAVILCGRTTGIRVLCAPYVCIFERGAIDVEYVIYVDSTTNLSNVVFNARARSPRELAHTHGALSVARRVRPLCPRSHARTLSLSSRSITSAQRHAYHKRARVHHNHPICGRRRTKTYRKALSNRQHVRGEGHRETDRRQERARKRRSKSGGHIGVGAGAATAPRPPRAVPPPL